jgi:hypothetical protein
MNILRKRILFIIISDIPVHVRTFSEGSRRMKLQEYLDHGHIKVVKLSALCTVRLYTPGDIPAIHFCQRLSQSHSVAGRIFNEKS